MIHSIKQLIKRRLQALSIRDKLLITILTAVVVPTIVAAVFSVSLLVNVSTKNATDTAQDKLRVAHLLFENKVQSMETAARLLASDNLIILNLDLLLYPSINQYLAATRDVRDAGVTAVLDAAGNVRASAGRMYAQEPGPAIFSHQALTTARENEGHSFVLRFSEAPFLREELGVPEEESDGIFFVSIMPIASYNSQTIGYSVAAYGFYRNGDVPDTFQTRLRTQLECPYLIMDGNDVLYYSEGQLDSGPSVPFTEQSPDGRTTASVIDGSPFLVSWFPVREQVGNSFVYFAVAYPETEILTARNQTIIFLFGVLAMGSTIAVFVAMGLARLISVPVLTVSHAVDSLAAGDFNIRIPVESKDEIGRLAGRFNDMSAQLSTTMERLANEILEHRHSEEEVRKLNEELEERVSSRTLELTHTNEALQESLETLKRTQEHLIEREKMAALGNLVAGMAHEINTPLGTSLTATTFLGSRTDTVFEQLSTGELTRSDMDNYFSTIKELVRIISSNLGRAAGQVSFFKQVAVDQETEAMRDIYLKEYIDEVILSLSPHLRPGGHKVDNLIPHDLHLITYPGAIYQIITNLVINAIRHGFDERENGHITISGRQVKKELEIDVHDNGTGIPEHLHKRIWEPFFTTKRGRGGTGLGLAIVYNLVSGKCRGRVECHSTPEEGTVFRIGLPLVP